MSTFGSVPQRWDGCRVLGKSNGEAIDFLFRLHKEEWVVFEIAEEFDARSGDGDEG
jgi:hypothetical protein